MHTHHLHEFACVSLCAVVRGTWVSLPVCHGVCAVAREICMSLPVCHVVCAVVGGSVQVLFLSPIIWVQDMKFTLSASILLIPNSCLGTAFGGYTVLLTFSVL